MIIIKYYLGMKNTTDFKNIIFFLFAFVIITVMGSCKQKNTKDIPGSIVHNPVSADGKIDKDQLPVIQFKDTIHDFGTVIQGEKVSFDFRFTNTGKTELLIAKVSASCGCTGTKYPSKPVKPGEESYITITFDSEGRQGYQYKSAHVITNTQPNMTKLMIKSKVVRPESMNN